MRVGIIGGGQLAWMMGPAAKRLGLELVVQTPGPADPAVAIANETILAPVDDTDATAKLAQRCEVITFENEFIDLQALQALPQSDALFRPRLAALAPLLDKLEQRSYLQSIGIPVPRFMALTPAAQLEDSGITQGMTLPFPLVLKARRHGYDGKGTHIVHTLQELQAVAPLGDQWMAEEFIPFERELAIMAARGIDGSVALYPVVETVQVEQVCRHVVVGQPLPEAIAAQAAAIARQILDRLDVVGVFGIELFLTADGELLVNELAPRTHNSGHYTLDACPTSQFEQQLRAVCGLPLGDTAPRWSALMVNLLGYETAKSDYRTQQQAIAQIPGAHLYWYGKPQSRPGRKLGHVTLQLAADRPISPQVKAIREQIDVIWPSD